MTTKKTIQRRILCAGAVLAAVAAVSACNPNNRQSGGQTGGSTGGGTGTAGDSQQPGTMASPGSTSRSGIYGGGSSGQ